MISSPSRLALAAMALAVALSVATARASQSGVVILCYHHVEDPAKNEYTVTSADFEAQMAWLKQNGFTVVGMEAVVASLKGGAPLPPKAVAITIDDGWRCSNTRALPILKKYGFPCTLFLYVTMVGKKGDKSSYEEYREMIKDPLITIGCHSWDHPNLLKDGGKLQGAEYEKFLEKQYVKSKEVLEKNLGRPIKLMSYPYGLYDARVSKLVKETGYEAAFSVNGAANSRKADPMFLNRIMIMKSDGLKGFTRKAQALPMEVEGLVPADGATVGTGTRRFSAVVTDPDVDLASVTMNVGGRGKCTIDQETRTATIQLEKDLAPKVYQVSVTGKDTKAGRACRSSWLVRVASGAGAPAAARQKSSAKAPASGDEE